MSNIFEKFKVEIYEDIFIIEIDLKVQSPPAWDVFVLQSHNDIYIIIIHPQFNIISKLLYSSYKDYKYKTGQQLLSNYQYMSLLFNMYFFALSVTNIVYKYGLCKHIHLDNNKIFLSTKNHLQKHIQAVL